MRKIPGMVDMRRTPEEKEEASERMMPTASSQNDYPYGLCISLTQDELKKLGLEDEEVSVGDMIHLHCMAEVTSVSKSDNQSMGPQCRVELQITHISAEDEDEENEQDEAPAKRAYF